MAKEHTFRFCIKNSQGLHSSVWRIWTYNSDCYLGQRGVTNQYKICFHESGQCQSGLTSELRKTLLGDPSWKGESRFYDQWNVPTILPDLGVVKLFQIIFPYSHLNDSQIKNIKNINWYCCDAGKAAVVAIYKMNIKYNDEICFEDKQVEISRLPLANGYFIVLSYCQIEEKNKYLDIIKNATATSFEIVSNAKFSKSYVKYDFSNEKKNLRSSLYYIENDSRYCFDTSVAKSLFGKELI